MADFFIKMVYFEIQKMQRVSPKRIFHQNLIFHQSVPLSKTRKSSYKRKENRTEKLITTLLEEL